MNQKKRHGIPARFAEHAHINQEQYHALYARSINDTETFWAEQARQFITWIKPWQTVTTGSFETFDVKWFVEGQLNACYNCVDRHLATRGNQVAIIWEGNHPEETQHITYHQLHEKVCQFANVLKQQGVHKGDRVCIYLPMIPEAIIAMLACARIGAIHSVVFGGFSPDSLQSRILDADCSLLITADEGLRGDKTIPFKINSDRALEHCPEVKRVIVVQRTGNAIPWNESKDIWYHDAMATASANCPIEPMESNAPLFILYTSGSTGQPKGVLHSTGGYLVYAAMTHHYVFNCQKDDIYWCTADVGWITGHSYCVYGPLLNGTTSLIFEGVPNYPTFSRYWEIIDKHQVNTFYTAPTAIRALRREGDDWVKKTHRKSLKLLGTVGEPINPDVWEWYSEIVGENRCPIVDTWWQTETGGILITPLPGATPTVPGSATLPFFGIVPEIIDANSTPIEDEQPGRLVIKRPWPGLMQTIYGNKQLFIDTYFKDVPGCYLTGDGAYRDAEGYITITGRMDDVIKVSGHRIGTEELESALISHHAVSEAAVVGIPNDITGEGIYAFITTNPSILNTDALKIELILHVRDKIGAIARLEVIQWASALPKTRSGKIMRRILRKIACNMLDDLGDLSTLADPVVVEQLILHRHNKNPT